MDSPYIHFKGCFAKLLVSTILCLICFTCFSQQVKLPAKAVSLTEVSGRYQKVNGSELLFLNKNETFVCLRNYINKSDVVVPLCDTLCKGFWSLKNGFIMLKNDSNFNEIYYAVVEAERHSRDSVYFRIVLPEEDALSYRNFRFSITTTPIYSQFEQTGQSEFAISRQLWKNGSFGFVIQNIAPNVYYGVKSYQRVYFKVFESYKPLNNDANYFTILVKNFNQCFYEAMDVDGEIIGIDNDTLVWKGNVYKKSR